jgi:mycoredoxin
LRLVSLLVLAAVAPGIQGEMVESVDQDGVIHYRSTPVDRQVIMYATAKCGYCRRVRAYFASREIEYTEYDIEQSATRRAEFHRLGGRGTPLIVIDGVVIHGYNPRAITRALDR